MAGKDVGFCGEALAKRSGSCHSSEYDYAQSVMQWSAKFPFALVCSSYRHSELVGAKNK